ncbi:low molecular weight protein-tyrosine-phosphatase [Comamonas sp. NLF-1-9]|uniref:low molecular weight protein-tyrosine-phosphatase n=1 Tax=Comamonas sp. NLF-1-9 TaxID=2853163 RepID=UPI001C469AFA|nr:low molecular weight protein-tyrosine-phosphatase [Comamonas sp. NLF-1-9]QXL85833.1 low molecular weight phosphotyrosine protein phosphatase [Comamonas sp. NLF-1-9]
MVCMGNICRSPTAEGVLRRMAREAGLAHSLQVDSAGTHDYHIGAAPDARACRHAGARGYDLSSLRARQLVREDFQRFDLVLVMDAANEAAARALCPPQFASRIARLTDFCSTPACAEVPDPYYGGDEGFERVLDLVEDACRGLLRQLQARGLS